MESIEFGFDTGMKKWFISFFQPNRWQKALHIVKDCKIKLNNMIIDTYSWNEPNNPQVTHGRLRCYPNKADIVMKQSDGLMTDVTLTGRDPIKFTKFFAKKLEISYDLPTMNWHLKVDDKQLLITRTYIGQVDIEKFTDNPIRIYMENVELLFSWAVTLINVPLEIKKDAPVDKPIKVVE